jgi:hypothetical protein
MSENGLDVVEWGDDVSIFHSGGGFVKPEVEQKSERSEDENWLLSEEDEDAMVLLEPDIVDLVEGRELEVVIDSGLKRKSEEENETSPKRNKTSAESESHEQEKLNRSESDEATTELNPSAEQSVFLESAMVDRFPDLEGPEEEESPPWPAGASEPDLVVYSEGTSSDFQQGDWTASRPALLFCKRDDENED